MVRTRCVLNNQRGITKKRRTIILVWDTLSSPTVVLPFKWNTVFSAITLNLKFACVFINAVIGWHLTFLMRILNLIGNIYLNKKKT